MEESDTPPKAPQVSIGSEKRKGKRTALEDIEMAKRTVRHAQELNDTGSYSLEVARAAFSRIVDRLKAEGISADAAKVLDDYLASLN